MLEREAALLERADMVFTGGRSLYRAKKERHPRVYCFPSSVDAAHFAQAGAEGAGRVPEAAEQTALPHPRLGYFGVIDERIDLPLLGALADAHPEWQIVTVGPTAKIEAAALPRHPNLHYFGQREYRQLPAYLAGWDVCLLPFALNRSTEFISPTKTLEYMAAGKMMVSTPIRDVEESYAQIVYLGRTREEFITACERALTAAPEERAARHTRYPFQGALHGLPAKVIQECIVGAIEASYGALRAPRKPNSKTNGSCHPGAVNDCCADGILEASAPLVHSASPGGAPPRNSEEFIYKVWGAGIAKHFAIPYNRKLWAVPLDQMETSWLGGRVPLPDLEEMIEGALSPVPKPMGPNARFGYPLRGGFQQLMDAWVPHLAGELRLNTAVTKVAAAHRTVTLAGSP